MIRKIRTLKGTGRLVAFGLALASLICLGAPVAEASNTRFAVVTITNPSHLAITYALRWGDGVTETFTLQPGDRRWHAWRYDYPGQNRSPVPTVTFDSDLSRYTYWETLYLTAFASPTTGFNAGKEYYFSIRGGAIFLYEA